jgi:hypothetical protein
VTNWIILGKWGIFIRTPLSTNFYPPDSYNKTPFSFFFKFSFDEFKPSRCQILFNYKYLSKVSGVDLNVSSKLALKSRLWTHHSSVWRVKTQTTQKVRLDLFTWSVMRNPWCVHNRLFNSYCDEKFKWTPDTISHRIWWKQGDRRITSAIVILPKESFLCSIKNFSSTCFVFFIIHRYI